VSLTLEGQYIIKNLTLISAAIVGGGTAPQSAGRSMLDAVTTPRSATVQRRATRM
jgi:hypothetical protein